MKKFWVFLAALLILLLPVFVQAADAGYSVLSFDTDVTVNENATLDVEERYVMDYTIPSHGMFRYMQLYPEITYETPAEATIVGKNGQQPVIVSGQDGAVTTQKQRVVIDNVEASRPVETYVEDGNFVMQIGDPDVLLTDEADFLLRYSYDMGDPGTDGFDMFYYNLTGNGWDAPIENVAFKVTMPKPFDASLLGFNVGPRGYKGYDPETLHYEVNGNVITGTYTGVLQPGGGITMWLELPDGYFVGARQDVDTGLVCVWIIGLVTLIVFVLLVVFGRSKKPLKVVEFYPPEGMTSADVGYIIDGDVEDRDVLSLLIYWADKGYLEIHEGEKKQEMVFVKLAELPADVNDYEDAMFRRLFKSGDTVSTKELQYTFYDVISATKGRVKAKFDDPETRIFKKSSQMLQDLVCMLGAFPAAFMAAISIYYATYEGVAPVIVALFVFFIGYFICAKYVKVINGWKSVKKLKRTASLIGSVVMVVAYNLVVALLCFWGGETFAWFAFVVALCGIAIALMAPFFRKLTEDGVRLQGRVLGLKEFIETVEKRRLEMLVKENPAYFYNVLPYAYVLGVSDTWSKQFEGLAVQPPTWYYGGRYDTFTTIYFTSMLMRSMNYTRTSLTARPQSSGGTSWGGGSGGGGFGGGGFSGGGFGGGGGGRW